MRGKRSKAYRITSAAVLDLEGIWHFTAERWSAAQADEYLSGRVATFENLAQTPAIVRLRTEFIPPVRIYACKSHVIGFRDDGEDLNIIRVRHGGEDWAIHYEV